jgi:hypothetical protein
VTIPAWKSAVGEFAAILGESTVESLAETVKNLAAIGPRISDPKGMLLAPEQRKQRAGHLLAMALGLALLKKGWQLEAQPGSFYLYRGSERVDVFEQINELANGKIPQEAWSERCKEWGIVGAPLSKWAGLKEPKVRSDLQKNSLWRNADAKKRDLLRVGVFGGLR